MKKRLFATAALAALMGLGPKAHAAEIVNTPDLTLDFGGRFQLLGELELLTEDPVRDHLRVYLFNTEDRLFASGTYKDTQFHFEEALGGEADSTSNNQINMLEFNADVPLGGGVSVMVGQFKVPTNLESADYDGNMLFAEKSEIMQLFFNTGYDTGLVLHGKSGIFDGLIGTISGAPDLPQRYLPEIFNFPPLVIARVGLSDGIGDDPFRPVQTGYEKPTRPEFALHGNIEAINDSNAGHSTDLALQSGYFTGFSSNSYYGNALLTTLWNPYLGKTAANFGPVKAYYWQAGLDGVYRAPLGDTVFTLQGQVNIAQFHAQDFAPLTINGKTVTSGNLNIGGGEVQASVGDDPFELAGRFAVVIPDNSLAVTTATAGKYAGITGSQPIYEVTLPSITWHMNSDVKLIAEAMWMIDTPIVFGGDGDYVIAEMPSQVSNATGTNPITRAPLVPAGKMMFQFQF